jgi:hypothetical protein
MNVLKWFELTVVLFPIVTPFASHDAHAPNVGLLTDEAIRENASMGYNTERSMPSDEFL